MTSKFFLTTPIYYVNDVPHIGHAYTTIAADVVARYWRQKNGKENVFFLTGTDEHGQKVAQAAKERGLSPKEFVDSVAPRFEEAWKLLNIDYDYFIRTTDPKHESVVTDLIQKIYDAGYVYPGTYKGLYCVGCEKFLTESELVDGKCPLHPNKEPIHQEEKNYFLKLKELSHKVLEKIENGEYQILPEEKKKEVVSRIKQGVEDISISRAGVSWGIPIPWDKSQTIYVWVDALINYYSATRFLKGKEDFWPANLHLVGKDILWFHTVIWQAILIAAGIPLPKTIFAHGFFTIDGAKMSKSLGNVISPQKLVEKYGVDGARYLVVSAYPFGSDGDISLEKFKEEYNAHLANGIGNLVSRIAKLCENSGFEFPQEKVLKFDDLVEENIKNYRFDEALKYLFDRFISGLDSSINKEEPWRLEGNPLKKFLTGAVSIIRNLSYNLKPFLPETSEKIEKQFLGPKIKSGPALFPRL
ncbi:methionine--tRNA ligase [Candidatus Woesebacteria bacterium RBG_19FT_COMBO_42_9]|uniref:Methionine--tRNA ligase n=1 Tax=Candidatus Woesebacteria bacterium RBG_16_42_24 TaxID=1802485 RepID=A0A1F7XL98_9BACT|nr:MAG: methionine--tRNA ligase [Candidatus Woesebacteria bacterium RBG_16_42_24]OGM17323.1 MAG: methionine--tRNA ligase [Candidatus Woesebacteria bacterium RBG_19FT_COMBO_42_9]OGM67252.1 MAG: methionine--tRNA ligase [Candidatus Woesebacteria bacterium RIFCSPLOWO2_01_FULL_43_11]